MAGERDARHAKSTSAGFLLELTIYDPGCSGQALRRQLQQAKRPFATRVEHGDDVIWRLAGLGRHGRPARRFFFRLLGRTARLSPRSIKVVIMKLGMYLHFCELHARKTGWDPWADPAGPPAPKKRLPVSASA